MGWLKERRRRKWLEEEFPQAWQEILKQNVVHYGQLSDDERGRLHEHHRRLCSVPLPRARAPRVHVTALLQTAHDDEHDDEKNQEPRNWWWWWLCDGRRVA